MKLKQILVMILAILLVSGLAACKSRDNVKEEKQRGARENVEIVENPKVEEVVITSSESSSQESSAPEIDPVPEETTRSFLSAAKSGTREDIQAYVDYNTLFNLQEGQGADWILQQILLRMKYEILSCDVKEDEATASVKITNVDMGIVLPIYFEQAMKIEYENAGSELQKSATELEAEYRKVFVELMAQHESGRIEKLVDIKLSKQNDKWSIKASPALGNAMLGGYIDAQSVVAANVQAQAELAASELQKVAKDAKSATEDEPEDKIEYIGDAKEHPEDAVSKANGDSNTDEDYFDIEMVKPRE